MQIKSLPAVIALASLAVAGPAQADFISGGISSSGGFDWTGTSTSIVSQLTHLEGTTVASDAAAFRLNPAATASPGCSGDLAAVCVPNPGSFALGFLLGGGGASSFSYQGFDFTTISFAPPIQDALTCTAGQCVDYLIFTESGVVTHDGFSPTTFVLNWVAQGTCNESVLSSGRCDGPVTATWYERINVAAAPIGSIPEPHTATLLGFGLLLLGFIIRRKS